MSAGKSDVMIDGPDGTFSAYVAGDSGGQKPGLLVIQEIFGVNQVMRDLCDGYAAAGYVALCPDLFWRQEPGIQLTDQSEAEWGRAFQLYQGFDEAAGVRDLVAALDHLRGLVSCSGVAGTIGWCLGGKLAYLMATRSDADANVGYYGVAIEAALDEADRITHPLMLHMAGKDQFCPPEAQAQIRAALDGNPNVTLHAYESCDHAFARLGGAHYDAAAAALANDRTAAFLAEHLAL